MSLKKGLVRNFKAENSFKKAQVIGIIGYYYNNLSL